MTSYLPSLKNGWHEKRWTYLVNLGNILGAEPQDEHGVDFRGKVK